MEGGQTQTPQKLPMASPWTVGVVLCVLVCWCISLALPVWTIRSNDFGTWDTVYGILPAFIGALSLLVGCPAWLGNLLLIPVAFLLLCRVKAGFGLSVIAFGVAATAYAFPMIYGDNDEGVIVERLFGFYVWLSTFIVMLVANAVYTFPTDRTWRVVRVAVATLSLLSIVVLEKQFPVGASPLETSLRDPSKFDVFEAAMAKRPSQKELDGALWWAVRLELSDRRGPAANQIAALLNAGANPNQSDPYGETLLMAAVSSSDRNELVRILVTAGADVNARRPGGKSVLDIAKYHGASAEHIQLLVDAGAKSSDAHSTTYPSR